MNYPFINRALLIALSILSLTTIISCSGRSGNAGQPGFGGPGGPGFARTTTVEVRDVQKATISDQIRAYGTVRAQDNVRVTPQVGERIVSIAADLGDTVRVGQVLARLNDRSFREQYNRDLAQVDQAQIAVQRDSAGYSRQLELFNLALVSQAELDNIQSTYAASRANLSAARASLTQSSQNLAYTEIRSPVSGVITRRTASPGDVVGTGQAIFEISNLVGYEVRLYLPLGNWQNIRLGQTVNMHISGAENFNTQGTVSRISPELDPVTGLGEVVVSMTQRGEGIFPGVLIESRINVQTKNDVVVIPRSAMVENIQTVIEPESNVIRLNRTYAAFVAQGDTIAVRRVLELGIQQGDRIEVLSGLNPGEKLIITGQTSLEEGSRIRISGAPRFDRTGAPQTGAPAQRSIDLADVPADTARSNQMLRSREIDPADSAAVEQARQRMQQSQNPSAGN